MPLFNSTGDDNLELSFMSLCAQACSDDVCAAGLLVCATLLSVSPGCEHISHAFTLRSPLLGPSACGLRVALQSPAPDSASRTGTLHLHHCLLMMIMYCSCC